jgi:putative acetyltransferase
MISAILPRHDAIIAHFWVAAWQASMPDIDFEARRLWILAHLGQMRSDQQIGRAYFENDLPIGFYTLFQDTGLIEQICVAPEAKGRGIGAALIGDAANHTPCRLNLVVNVDNRAARRFYAKLGFEEVSRSFNPVSSLPVLTLKIPTKGT